MERYKFRRFIEFLESREGRGTELVTLYIPPGKRIDEVIGYLRQELSTASNIKSKGTRKAVMDAIESAIQRLKLFKDSGPNGLVVFSGAIPQNGEGTEKIEVYHMTPPEPINFFLYRCDSKFYLEPLKELLKERETYGIIAMDNEDAAIAVFRGKMMVELRTYTSGIPGKHRAGGQSSRRFERLRDQALQEYYSRLAEHANEIFLSYPDIKAIILAGPGPTKDVFLKEGKLHYTFRDKIHVIDTSYAGEEGVREAIDKAADILVNLRLVRERRLVDDLMRRVATQNTVVYGLDSVREALRRRQLELLMVSEELDLVEVTYNCPSCGYEFKETLSEQDLISIIPEKLAGKCPSCGAEGLRLIYQERLMEVLLKEAEETNTKVEIISAGHESGEIFLKTFNGVAGVLKGFSG
ncbi:MAG: peptide chain release factor aRF-1 [Nitrososphaerota archaeon]|nr:peptide chain release factor aRF-1 [Candidatus Calditenuaceae archaeon]MDW8072969.1 peptide chain release factor aRF-1 [Nitrososphaerota archaeon]